MDLFKPVSDEAKQHPNFKAVSNSKFFGPEQNVVQDWAKGFVDRDNKFVFEFQTTFNSSFWELYLNAAFRELGFDLDFSKQAPDFWLKKEGMDFTVEAVTASAPNGYRPEWEAKLDRNALKEFDAQKVVTLATIRLSNSIASKHQKYLKSYQHLEHVKDKPFVLAVAPFEQPFFFSQNDNAMKRVLYGFDRLIYHDDLDEETRIVFGESKITQTIKPNGASIPLGLFTRPGMEEVSAVIFSNTATWTKVRALSEPGKYPVILTGVRYNENGMQHRTCQGGKGDYEESLLDGLHVFLNPFAKHPLDVDKFKCGEMAVHSFIPETQQYTVEVNDGFLFQHSSMVFVPKGTGKELGVIQKQKESEYVDFQLPPFPPGELIPFEGQNVPFVDNHLAHHKGWTILVCRDLVDGDWGAQALQVVTHTVGNFIDHNQLNKSDHLMLGSWHDSAKETLLAIQKRIDQKMDPVFQKKARRKERQARQKALAKRKLR